MRSPFGPGEFALDSTMPPVRILRRQTPNHGADLFGDRRTPSERQANVELPS